MMPILFLMLGLAVGHISGMIVGGGFTLERGPEKEVEE